MARIISDAHVQRLKRLLDATRGTIVFGGQVDAARKFIVPTVVKDVQTDDALMSECVTACGVQLCFRGAEGLNFVLSQGDLRAHLAGAPGGRRRRSPRDHKLPVGVLPVPGARSCADLLAQGPSPRGVRVHKGRQIQGEGCVSSRFHAHCDRPADAVTSVFDNTQSGAAIANEVVIHLAGACPHSAHAARPS